MSRIAALAFVLAAMSALAQQGEAPAVRTFQPHANATTSGTLQPADTPAIDTAHAAKPGEVTIHMDEKITRLMEDFADRKHPIKGYRVQIYLGERSEAEEVRRAFLIKHVDLPAYLSYLAPNFRVRVGDLRSRLEAEKLRQEIIGEFPGSYIVPDEIEMPRLEEH